MTIDGTHQKITTLCGVRIYEHLTRQEKEPTQTKHKYSRINASFLLRFTIYTYIQAGIRSIEFSSSMKNLAPKIGMLTFLGQFFHFFPS